MKACTTQHVYAHSGFGLGVGLIAADLWPGLAKWWIGALVLIAALIAHKDPKQKE